MWIKQGSMRKKECRETERGLENACDGVAAVCVMCGCTTIMREPEIMRKLTVIL